MQRRNSMQWSEGGEACAWQGGHIVQVLPWALALGGGALAIFGALRRDKPGAAAAAGGGLMLLQGVRGIRNAHPQRIHAEHSVHINRPVEEVYRFWRDFENLARFLSHLDSVKVLDERTSRWRSRAPLGMSIEWESEILDEQINEHIDWSSLPGSLLPNTGSVQFKAGSPYHGGTDVTVVLEYQPPAGRLGMRFARLFGDDPERQIREDLRHFKQLLECGEIPTSEGQSHGRRTPFVRMVQAAASDEPMRERNRNWLRRRQPTAI